MSATLIINETLDRIQKRRNIGVGALASELGVDPATIWRWRQGDIGKAAAILIPLIVKEQPQPETEICEIAP